jgi:MYXO-CTERM domain-containing protein
MTFPLRKFRKKPMKKTVSLSIGIIALVLQNASAQIHNNLFTTANDWSQWVGSSGNAAAVDPTFSTDNNIVSGLGNTGTGTGTGNGSLAITVAAGTGFSELANHGPGEGGNQAFLSAIDPGQVGGVPVAYSGTMLLTYSLPAAGTFGSGTFLQMGVEMQYAPDYFYTAFFSTSTDLLSTDPNGNELFQATIPYSIPAAANTPPKPPNSFNAGFGFGVFVNSDYSGLAFPVYVDQIQSVTPAPEPCTMALAGLGALGFAFVARRRHV